MGIIKIFTNYDDGDARKHFMDSYGYGGDSIEKFKNMSAEDRKIFLAREDAFIEGLKFRDSKLEGGKCATCRDKKINK